MFSKSYGLVTNHRMSLRPNINDFVQCALGNFFWHYGVSRSGVVVSSMYNNLLPVAAVAVTVLMGGWFTGWQLLGAGVILSGVALAQFSPGSGAPRAHQPPPEPSC